MFGSLIKAVVGVAVETPVAILADAVTLGGALTDKNTTYTGDAVSKVVKNISNTTK